MLERHGQSNTVNLIVHLLLEDENGEKARKFAEHCPPYKNATRCKDVSRLTESFKNFVKHILFSEKKEVVIKETPNEKAAIIDVQVQKLNEQHAQIDTWLNTWSEKYEDLLPYIIEYLSLLDDEYLDPKPESWQRESDDDDTDFLKQQDDESEYIPNYHLDCLSRLLDMFEAKVAVSDKKIRRSRGQKEEQNKHIEVIKAVLPILSALRDLPWDILDRYPYDHEIRFRAESILNSINAILDENK